MGICHGRRRGRTICLTVTGTDTESADLRTLTQCIHHRWEEFDSVTKDEASSEGDEVYSGIIRQSYQWSLVEHG